MEYKGGCDGNKQGILNNAKIIIYIIYTSRYRWFFFAPLQLRLYKQELFFIHSLKKKTAIILLRTLLFSYAKYKQFIHIVYITNYFIFIIFF